MFEDILNVVKQYSETTIIKNPAVPDSENDNASRAVADSVLNGIKDTISAGNLKEVLSVFAGKADISHSSLKNTISNKLTQQLTNNNKVEANEANNIAKNLVPEVLKNMIGQTQDPNNSLFDMNKILGAIGGNVSGIGKGVDFQALLGKVMQGGLDKDGDGDVDLQDAIAMFTGANQNSKSNASSQHGGLVGMLKGFFK